jgi:hypothetical protein
MDEGISQMHGKKQTNMNYTMSTQQLHFIRIISESPCVPCQSQCYLLPRPIDSTFY